MDKLEEEMKALEIKSKELADKAWQLKVEITFNNKRIKLLKDEMEAMKPTITK